MPILSREPDLFPIDLLDRDPADVDVTRSWWVVHTRPRQEKALARRLLRLAIPHYVPQIEQTSRSPAGRRRVSYVPLFPGYAFLFVDDEERVRSFSSNSIVRLLEVPDGEQLRADLQQINRLTEMGRPLMAEPQLPPGSAVRITRGPFENFEGRILDYRAGRRLLVVVNYLQQGVSVELDDDEIEEM